MSLRSRPKTSCLTSSGICETRFAVVGRANCKRQPKPASAYTQLGFSFSSRSTGRHTGTNGVLETSSRYCTDMKREEMDGRVQLGEYGIYPEGPKPPVWVLTGETAANRPVKVFMKLNKIESIDEDDLPLTADQRASVDAYGLFVGTGECGLGRQACYQKCRVKGGPCTTKSGSGKQCSGCKPCCCSTSGGGEPVSEGCSFSYTKTCVWEGLHLVTLDNNIKSTVRTLVTSAIEGVNRGWVSVNVDPAILDSVDFNPGNLLGMFQWNSETSGAKVASAITGTRCTINIAGDAKPKVRAISNALKGDVALGPEYSVDTQFFQTSLPIAIQIGPGTDTFVLAKMLLYVPKLSIGIRTLSAPDAGEAMCCLFNDEDNTDSPGTCEPAVSSYTMCYTSAQAQSGGISWDIASYSGADEVKFFVSYVVPTGAASTGTAFDVELGQLLFRVTPYSVTNIPGVTIARVVSGSPSTTAAVSLGEGSEVPLPITTSQASTYGNLSVKLAIQDSGANQGFTFTVFRRDGLSSWTIPTAPFEALEDTFETINVVNQSTQSAVSFGSAPLSYDPSNPDTYYTYGMLQYVMSAAGMLLSDTVSVWFNVPLGGVTYKFALSPSTAYRGSSLLFSITNTGTGTKVAETYTTGVSTLTASDGSTLKITQLIQNEKWVVQIVRLDEDACAFM